MSESNSARQDEIDAAFQDLSDDVGDINDVAQPSQTNAEGDGGAPDPEDLDPVDVSQHVYQRDENGNLLPQSSAVKIDGEWKRVEHLPPTKGFLMRVQKRFGGREDIDMEEIDDLMNDFYVDPDVDDWNDTETSFYIPMMKNMVKEIMGDVDDETTQELRDAVESRQDEGN